LLVDGLLRLSGGLEDGYGFLQPQEGQMLPIGWMQAVVEGKAASG